MKRAMWFSGLLAVWSLALRSEVPDSFLTAVESSGSQWVDTGIPAKSGVRIVFTGGKYNGGTQYGCLCGARNKTTGKKLGVFSHTEGFAVHYGDPLKTATYNGTTYSRSDGVAGRLYAMDCTLAKGRQALSVDGKARLLCDNALTAEVSALTDDIDIGTNLFVFATAVAYTKPTAPEWDDKTKAMLYGLQIYTNNAQDVWTLARDFKPCLKDGQAGLYDTVEEKIHFSASSTALLPVRTWTGKGDDNKFSTAANWDAPPVSGTRETLLFDTTLAGSITAENDLEDLTVGRLETSGSGSLALTGNRINLQGTLNNTQSAMLFLPNPTNKATHVIGMDLRFMSIGQILLGADCGTGTSYGQITVNGDWTFDETVSHFDLYGRSYDITVNGSMSGPATHLDFDLGANGCSHFPKIYGSVTFREIVFNEATTPSYPGFYKAHALKATNATNMIHYASRGPFLMVDNVFDERTVLGWWMKGYQWTGRYHGMAFGQGTVQTFDRIEIEKWKLTKASSDAGAGGTNFLYCAAGHDVGTFTTKGASASLVLKATANAKAYVCLTDDLSLTYDPQGGSYTQEFACCRQETTGHVFVKGGTLHVSEEGSFPYVPHVHLATGATLLLDTSATPVMGSLDLIQMEASSTCRVTSVTAQALAAGRTCAVLDAGAVFDVAADRNVTLARLLIDGEEVAAGTYTAATADWIAGAGSVTVAGAVTVGDNTFWFNPEGGAWREASNWSHGVPTAAQKVTFPLTGTYDITCAVDDALPSNLNLASAAGCVSVRLADGTAFSSGTVAIGDNGRLVAEGRLVISNKTVVAITGGELLVAAGGELLVTNVYTGTFTVKGSSAHEGRVTLSNATLTAAMTASGGSSVSSAQYLEFQSGGVLAGTNSVVRIYGSGEDDQYVHLCGGEMRLTGASAYEPLKRPVGAENIYTRFDSGEVVFGGSSVLRGAAFRLYPDTTGYGRIRFEDKATMAYRDGFVVGRTAGTTSIVEFASSATQGTVDAGISIKGLVASGAGYGEMRVSKGFVPFGWRGLTIGGADASRYSWQLPKPTGCEGVLRVTGGVLYPRGREQFNEGYVNGFCVGEAGCAHPDTVGRPCLGRVYLAGGAITNRYGAFVLGGIRGRGFFEQTGGDFSCRNGGVYGTGIVGAGGGIGSYALYGGTASVCSSLYLGGAFTNVFGESNAGLLQPGLNFHWPKNAHDALGTLTVTGGMMTVAKTLNLGFDGTGVVHMVGAQGRLSVGTLVLSNATVAATAEEDAYRTASRLDFTFVNGGIAPISVAGAVTNTAGTALTVSLGDLPESAFPSSSRLIACTSWEGPLPEVTVTGAAAKRAEIQLRAGRGLYLHFARGSVLIMR